MKLILFAEKSLCYGETLNITCMVDAMPPAQIHWKYLVNNVVIISYDLNPFPLKKFSFENEGSYSCEASNGIGQSVEREVKVRGIAIQAPNILRSNSDQIIVSSGDRVKLNCHCEMCEPLSELLWIHENNGTDESKFGELKSNTWSNQADFSLTLDNISVNDAGSYTCHMKNDFGHDRYMLKIVVKNPPRLEKPNGNSAGETNPADVVPYSTCIFKKILNESIFSSNSSHIIMPTRLYACSIFNDTKQFAILLGGKN